MNDSTQSKTRSRAPTSLWRTRALIAGPTALLFILFSCAPTRAASPQTGRTATEHAKQKSTPKKPVAELEAEARKRELTGRDYPYHDLSRKLRGKVNCPKIDLVEYQGEVIAYNRPIEINKLFRERLIRFEKIVAEVAIEVYGRAPARIIHAGGHTCKSVGGRRKKLSEHAFGHAIDVSGFKFSPAARVISAKNARKDAKKPKKDKEVDATPEAFTVSVKKHWKAQQKVDPRHRRFLHRLAEELKARGPFSTMLGPAYKGHDRFFHFDFGPQFFFRI